MSQDTTAVWSREYPTGTVLFEERDPGSRMYVIRSGKVKIYRASGGTELVLAFLTAGEFFGEMALLEGLPRSASAMVVEPSVLVEVDATTFQEMIRRNVEVAVRIMRKLAGRVRELDGRLEKMLVDNGITRALEVLRWLLPQGMLEGDWVRVRGAAAHLDIAAQAGVPASQAKSVIARLEHAGCMRMDGDDLLVGSAECLDSYANYLALKRTYDPLTNDATKTTQQKQMHRLLAALQLSTDEVEKRQKELATQYDRYQQLAQRYGAVENG